MPLNSKNVNRKGIAGGETEKNRSRGTLPEKSMSFHGRGTMSQTNSGELRRPKTLPELFSTGQTVVGPLKTADSISIPPRLTKLLLNVTVQGSLGAVQIVISPESTVNDLIDAAIRLYVKEARRPLLPESEPSRFDLHYSQFSLESIGRDQKLISLGSRNFFLCGRKEIGGFVGGGSSESCSKEAEKVAKTGFHWLKFIGF
ncbi:hypothetical protein EUTSA_v10017255mg [Eutrema salsugineum]|uniref:DUF7054 domain-containing protein n=1 Tax=Eutrema salsugineum TaxID=72664 RepID=V4M863_EUTSA|nr:uncharacterized protein At4g22758 [Eutrema salsugineum]ESQ51247.1 hypothetical protein EUTSA_v10017255mg [Eutrema salsugineum]